jgi:hypothetical protein
VRLCPGQSLDTFLRDLPTSERIQQPGWWPTKPLRPSEQAQLAGWQSCAKCHSSPVNSQRQTGMAHALMPAEASVILQQHAEDNFPLLFLQRRTVDKHSINGVGVGLLTLTCCIHFDAVLVVEIVN